MHRGEPAGHRHPCGAVQGSFAQSAGGGHTKCSLLAVVAVHVVPVCILGVVDVGVHVCRHSEICTHI